MYLFNIVADNISQENIISFIDNLLDNGITDFQIFINRKYNFTYENYIIRSDYTDIRNFYEYIYNNYDNIIGRNAKIIYLNCTYEVFELINDIIYQIKKIYTNNANAKFINITNDVKYNTYNVSTEYLKKRYLELYKYSPNFTEQEAKEEANVYVKVLMNVKKLYQKIFKEELTIKKFYFSEYGFFFHAQCCKIKKIFFKTLLEECESSKIDTITCLTEAFLFGTLSTNEPFLLDSNTDNFYSIQHKNKNYDNLNYILNMNNNIHYDTSCKEVIDTTEEVIDTTEEVIVQSNNTVEISDISTENTIINEYITNYNCVNCTKYNFSGKPHLFTYFCSIQCKEYYEHSRKNT